jgi:hypothetical protein
VFRARVCTSFLIRKDSTSMARLPRCEQFNDGATVKSIDAHEHLPFLTKCFPSLLMKCFPLVALSLLTLSARARAASLRRDEKDQNG